MTDEVDDGKTFRAGRIKEIQTVVLAHGISSHYSMDLGF